MANLILALRLSFSALANPFGGGGAIAVSGSPIGVLMGITYA